MGKPIEIDWKCAACEQSFRSVDERSKHWDLVHAGYAGYVRELHQQSRLSSIVRESLSVNGTFRLDAEGRLVRSPAIEKLLEVGREMFAMPWPPNWPAGLRRRWRVFRDALSEVDREGRSLGQIAPESSSFAGSPENTLAGGPSDVVGGETRNPAITPGPGAEQGCSPLSPADLTGADRACKK